MYRPPKPQPPPPPIRMPTLGTIPSYEHVAQMLAQAQQARGRIVELVFINPNQHHEKMLSVRCPVDDSDPIWFFYSQFRDDHNAASSPDQNPPAWSYQSPDVALIHNIVTRECMGGPVEESAQQITTLSGFRSNNSGADSLAQAFRNAGAGLQAAQTQASMQGDLKNIQVPKLLLSVAMHELTGRLYIESPQGGSEIFFEAGKPLHANALDSQGDMAIIEMITWQDGRFEFHDNERTTARTVSQSLDVLVQQGTPLREYVRELNTHGLTMESFLVRRLPNLTEADFERAIYGGIPLDLNMQKLLYQCIDNQSTVFDVLRRRPMAKTEWLPIIYNLVKCDLVVISNKAAQVQQQLPLEAMGIDRATIQAGMRSLHRPETDLINYPLILHFVEQEFFRFESSGLPFSLIVFELAMRTPDGPQPLPIPHIREIAKRINLITRKIDLLAHFETFSFMILLPYTNVNAASVVANRITQAILSSPVCDLDSRYIAVAMGIAGLPEDCNDIGMLLAGAKEAKKRAQQGSSPIVLLKDIQS